MVAAYQAKKALHKNIDSIKKIVEKDIARKSSFIALSFKGRI